jgi:cell division protein FtsB
MVGLFEKEKETSKKKELILAQIETLRSREKKLSDDIEKLKTEEGVEETIRDKFQVVKEGEKMVVIVDEGKNVETSPDTIVPHSFWGWVKKTFKIN